MEKRPQICSNSGVESKPKQRFMTREFDIYIGIRDYSNYAVQSTLG